MSNSNLYQKTTYGNFLTRRLAAMGEAASYVTDSLKYTNKASATFSSVLPYLGMIQGGFGFINGMCELSSAPSESLTDELVLAGFNIAISCKLMRKSYEALNGGSLGGVYLYMALASARNIVHTCEYLRKDTCSTESRNKLLTSMLIETANLLGWMSMYMGNPVAGTAFLAISALYSAKLFQQQYAPNMFTLFSTKGVSGAQHADVPRTAPGFSPAK